MLQLGVFPIPLRLLDLSFELDIFSALCVEIATQLYSQRLVNCELGCEFFAFLSA